MGAERSKKKVISIWQKTSVIASLAKILVITEYWTIHESAERSGSNMFVKLGEGAPPVFRCWVAAGHCHESRGQDTGRCQLKYKVSSVLYCAVLYRTHFIRCCGNLAKPFKSTVPCRWTNDETFISVTHLFSDEVNREPPTILRCLGYHGTNTDHYTVRKRYRGNTLHWENISFILFVTIKIWMQTEFYSFGLNYEFLLYWNLAFAN